MLVSSTVASPFRLGIDRPDSWPFSPLVFREEFQARPWYAFEDWHPQEEELGVLFRTVLGQPTFHLSFPSIENITCRLPDGRSELVLSKLINIINYAGNIIWDEEGRVFVNYCSDFLMTNLSAEESRLVFGCSLADMWQESINPFTDPSLIRDDSVRQLVEQFVDELKLTWNRE